MASWRRRLLALPLVRLLLATAPIVGWLVVASKAAQSLHLAPRTVANALVPALLGVVVVLLYVAYVRLVERRPVDELAARAAPVEAARGFVLGMALFSVTLGVLLLAGVATVTRGDGWRALASGFLAALGAAMIEETLLRAVFFRIVESSLGTFIALSLSAALFGVLHASNPGATVVSTVAIALEAGVLLAAAFVWSRRLWLPFGLHVGWNFTEGGLFGASVSGTTPYGLWRSHFAGAPLLSGGAFGPEASVVAVALCLSAGIAMGVGAVRRGRVIRPFWRR